MRLHQTVRSHSAKWKPEKSQPIHQKPKKNSIQHARPYTECHGPTQDEEPVRHSLRDEAKEVRLDERRTARKSRRCIRWNTLRIFSTENDADGRGSFAAVERSMSDRLMKQSIHCTTHRNLLTFASRLSGLSGAFSSPETDLFDQTDQIDETDNLTHLTQSLPARLRHILLASAGACLVSIAESVLPDRQSATRRAAMPDLRRTNN